MWTLILTGKCNDSYNANEFNYQPRLLAWNPITPRLFNSHCWLTIHRQPEDTGTLIAQLSVNPEFSSHVLACSASVSIDDGKNNPLLSHPNPSCLLNQVLSQSITTTNTSLKFQIAFGSVGYRIIQWRKTLFNLNISYISKCYVNFSDMRSYNTFEMNYSLHIDHCMRGPFSLFLILKW